MHFPARRFPELKQVLMSLVERRVRYKVCGRDPEGGLDCAGMVAYPLEAIGASFEYDDMSYRTHWFREAKVGEHYLKQLRRFMEVRLGPVKRLLPGDLLLFRMTANGPVSHTGWMMDDGHMVHIYDGHRGVCLTRPTTRFWAARFAGYAYPKEGVL